MSSASPLRIHAFLHVPFEGLGSLEPWIKSRGHKLSYTRFYAGEKPPRGDVDWLIVMGGPMSVSDEAAHPWLKEEKRYLESTLALDKAVLGICLGAQLMAETLGARVYRNREKEIGWFPVKLEEQAQGSWPAAAFAPEFTAFHWHGDTFDLPAGALHLARSEICLNQAFLHGDRALALQFHPEVTPASLGALAENCKEELRAEGAETSALAPGNFVQTASELRTGLAGAGNLNAMLEKACLMMETMLRSDQ